jgi:hypothetical protein
VHQSFPDCPSLRQRDETLEALKGLVDHLAHDFNEACYKIRVLNVFMRFIKNNELVERFPCISYIREELEQNDEEAERLIFFDELVPEIDNHKSSRTNHLPKMCVIVDIFGCEIQSLQIRQWNRLVVGSGTPG